ncbi:hypothetical protein IL306_015103 [Fusarium sp. DS 682]|nr:hypothetical protein IL306_015103 [Fusarium sp. DS 682]
METSSAPATTSFGTTATSIETTTASSASSIPSFVLDLRNAILGPGASFYPPPDGDSILMSPVASDSTLNRRQLPKPPPFTVPNSSIVYYKIQLPSIFINVPSRIINITISSTDPAKFRKRAERSPCVFEVLVDGEVVHAEPITGNSGDLELSTNPFPQKDSNELTFRQLCSGVNVDIILQGVVIKDGRGASSTPIPSISIGTATSIQTGDSTETNSADFTTNSEGDTVFPTETVTGANSERAITNSEGETVVTTGTTSIQTGDSTETNSADFTTNSEGETVFPTDTATGANSADFTTNSEGETIFPTGTATAATSEGATTNSEGETIFPTGTATGTITSASSTATLPAGFPGDVGDFTLFGCVASTAGFPTFTLAESSPLMDLNICATLCAGRAYFGVYDTSCYCGDEIDAADTSRVNLDQCDIECPGDTTQFCGGESRSRLRARQAIPSNRLLTVYTAAEAAVTLTESVTQTVTDQETVVTTFTTTVTRASGIATEAVTATLLCSAGKCQSSNSDDVAVYIFVEINGKDYDGQWIYVSEPCACAGG